jgi:predicted nuclease of predicted toxin-antitoxin system
MIRLLADENFDHDILRGLLRRRPALDLVVVQETEMAGASDPDLLEWAARQNRIILTHDVQTMTKYVYERLGRGLPVAGVVEVRHSLPVGLAIEGLLLMLEASRDDEWRDQVRYVIP